MKATITVREYARLTTTTDIDTTLHSLDRATISASAFDYLCKQSARLSAGGAALVQTEGHQWLKLDNYVGVIETPCGTTIEILPKHTDCGDDAPAARRLLIRMLGKVLDLPPREVGPASLAICNGPLSEWLIHRFLQDLDHLIKRGLRFDYLRVEEERRFLRGRLDISKQMRQAPGRQHLFHIQHDVFEPDRAENRLIRSALDLVCKTTQNPENWRLAHELASYLAPIPASRNIRQDFLQWKHDRLMAHYRAIKPWCELILNRQTPLAVAGEWHGISFLFPMEKLFERYVEICLRRELPSGTQLISQASSHHLCHHNGNPWFQLQPDFLIQCDEQPWILDTKWKRLDSSLSSTERKYGLSQSDFYQLFAYGQRYLEGKGDMMLIYPKTAAFSKSLPCFYFSDELRLWVVPFDLETGKLLEDETAFCPVQRLAA